MVTSKNLIFRQMHTRKKALLCDWDFKLIGYLEVTI